jgi:hypothetical protein
LAVDMSRLSAITSTTTVRVSALERVRGFTVKLLVYLKRGEKRCIDITVATGKTRHYVHEYLERMQIYGLARKKDAFWHLTDLGDFMADYFIDFLKELKKERKKESKQIDNRQTTEEPHLDHTIQKAEPKPQRQTVLSLWLSKSPLGDKEKEVVELLTRHYEETGSKFLYFKTPYDLAERLQVNPAQVTEIMMNLQQDHVAYHWRDKGHDAWKVGLYKAFVEVIAKQEP